MFRTIMLLFGLILIQMEDLSAQLNPYNFRIGAGVGYSNYYGDLSNYRFGQFPDWDALGKMYAYNPNYNKTPSWNLSLEQRLNASWGLIVNGGQFGLSMSDRFVDKDDNLIMNSPNFNRALNFNTRVRDVGLGLVFRADNGKILRENAILAPYLTLSGGWIQFKPKGDLLDSEGNLYDYSGRQTQTDGIFETDLSELEASSNNGYNNNAFYLAAGIGMRLRLSKQVELYFQSDIKRTGTDYLDDVDGATIDSFDNSFQEYAAYPGNYLKPGINSNRGDSPINKDWFFNHQFGLKISLFPTKAAFRASTISPSTPVNNTIDELKSTPEKKDTSENGVNYHQIEERKSLVEDKKSGNVVEEKQETDEKINATINTVKSSTTETAAKTSRDSIGEVPALRIQNNPTTEEPDTTSVWQYPFRRPQEDEVPMEDREKVYNKYNQKITVQEEREPGVITEQVITPQQPQYANSSVLYPLPYYRTQTSTEKVDQPRSYANQGPPMNNASATYGNPTSQVLMGKSPANNSSSNVLLDSTATNDSIANVQLDSLAANDSISIIQADSLEVSDTTTREGFEAIQGQGIDQQKYRLGLLPKAGVGNAPIAAQSETKAALIENGLYTEIYFESNQGAFLENEALKLAPLVEMLKQTPKAKILVKGYADNTGSTAYNLQLIEQRVSAVVESLTNKFGVTSDKIERQPGALLIRGSQRSSRPEDRKVEVQVFY